MHNADIRIVYSLAVPYLGTTHVPAMRSCGPRPGIAMVHATPAAIKRERETAQDERHVRRHTRLAEHRDSDTGDPRERRRPGDQEPDRRSRPANLAAIAPHHRMPESPRDQTARHGQHRYQAAHDRDQHRNGCEPAGDKAPERLATGGEVCAQVCALGCQLLNLRRDDGGGTSELVGRDRRIARGDLRRRSSQPRNGSI